MTYTCGVCGKPVQPDARGRVRLEGVTPEDHPKQWAWGPIVVHDPCRLDVVTPFDDRIGAGYVRTWELMKA